MLSQEPVQSAMPSWLTPRQLTRFSCPARTPTRSPLRVSHTLQLKSSYPAKSIRPETENATDVMPHRTLSCTYWFNSRSARRSNSRHDASSEPVANASPFGKNLRVESKETNQTERVLRKPRSTYETALISDSCPVKVWTALPVRMSHTFAVASHAPDTNTF